MTITIEIPDSTVERLNRVLKTMQKPPRVTDDGSVVIEPMYRDLSEWITEILAANFKNYLAGMPDEEELQVLRQIEQLQQRIQQRVRPTVRLQEPRGVSI